LGFPVLAELIELIQGLHKALRAHHQKEREGLGDREDLGDFEVKLQFQAAALTHEFVERRNLILIHGRKGLLCHSTWGHRRRFIPSYG
jgi:hypothetical protein